MKKTRVATLWLDGCSGCHMSLLDLDERLLEFADKMELVYSPLVDAQDFPEDVDVTLMEGAVANEEDEKRILLARSRSTLLVALGDCAVTGNVPAMRNNIALDALLGRIYISLATANPGVPLTEVPRLEPTVIPVHELVKVDVFVPGCPPSADLIYTVLCDLFAGRTPDIAALCHFGN